LHHLTIRNVKLQLTNVLDLPEIMSFEPAAILVIPIFFIAFDRNTTGYEATTTDFDSRCED